jgi:phospholipase/carboxylesterase
VTCLVWENAGPGRAGVGAFGEIALAVPEGALGFWIGHCLEHGIAQEGPVREFGEPVLRLKDPDGLIVKLVATNATPAATPWADAPVPADVVVQGLRAATLFSEAPDASAAFLRDQFGLVPGPTEGAITRLVAPDGRAIDMRDSQGFWTAAQGGGTIDHLALRAASLDQLGSYGASLTAAAAEASEIKDRHYFVSLYLREPGGALMEIATDAPGMAVDEPVERLGETLIVPDAHAAEAEDLRILLPPVARPGESRLRKRDLPFLHTIRNAETETGETLFLLHGTGGDETDLLPLGSRIAPGATLIGLRGRSTEEGINRWFRRLGPKEFDDDDIRAEAAALAHFAREAARGYGLEPGRITWVGYSNGANMIGALALLHPEVVRRAILMRAMPVFGAPPRAALAGRRFLVLNGTQDPDDDHGVLAGLLAVNGAEVQQLPRPVGHGLNRDDFSVAADWYGALRAE